MRGVGLRARTTRYRGSSASLGSTTPTTECGPSVGTYSCRKARFTSASSSEDWHRGTVE